MKKVKVMLLLLSMVGLCGCGTVAANDTNENTNEVVVSKEQEDAETIINPWTDSDEQGVLEATGFDLALPEGATDVLYSYMNESKLAQVMYKLDGIDWNYRVQAADKLQDISGMNYEWDVTDDGFVAGKSAVYMGYSDADGTEDTIDGVKYLQVVNWYDDVAGVVYSLSACGENVNGMDIQVYAENIYAPLQGEVDGDTDALAEYKTYVTELFDGSTLEINEQNILSQEPEENVLETTKVPADAEVIAPGRDYVYLADDLYYYVEDEANGLLTIATKGENNTSTILTYEGDGFSFDYDDASFFLYEDTENNSVTVSYDKEGVDIAGSNVITFTKCDNVTCQDLIKEKVKDCDGNEADIEEITLNENASGYTYFNRGESDESELKVTQAYYVIQCDDSVVLIDVFRTMGPDEATEMAIDDCFEYVFQTLK